MNVYLDTSVVLAELLAEDIHPPESLWRETLFSSRLLEYELWMRINARGLGESHGEQVRAMVARVNLVELKPEVLSRLVEPFPGPVRTLDAIHLATVEFLVKRRLPIQLATYDRQMKAAAEQLDLSLYPL
ncbi:MAG: PIN domain-containing protein [Bradymonadales bacterium]|nr:PIN domain-containing protein [Bradymonadales bacterium]